MVDRKEASFILEGRPTPATGRQGPPDGCEGAGRFELAVVFTSFDATIAALKMAGALASGLSAHITLVVAQAVPYPLPLEDPPVRSQATVQWKRRYVTICVVIDW